MAARTFRVRGLVQGVGFRYTMCGEARRLGLDGWVRNRLDGSVEAVALGDAAQLDALLEWAARGPLGARVDAVESQTIDETEAAGLGVTAGSGFRQAQTA